MNLYDKNKLTRMKWGYLDDDFNSLLFTIDGKSAVIIPTSKFYLTDAILDERKQWMQFNTVFKIDNDYVPASISGIEYEKQDTFCKLCSENGVEVWFNKRRLKYFDDKTLQFKIKSPVSPVMVYENNELVGLIMPVRRGGNNAI